MLKDDIREMGEDGDLSLLGGLGEEGEAGAGAGAAAGGRHLVGWSRCRGHRPG